MVGQLVLTVTRACNLRCSYCPTAKDGWPSLSPDDAVRAVKLFAQRYGGGDIKLFGGEPLLVPEVVRAAMDAARELDPIRRVYLSTNALGLDDDWLAYLRGHDKAVLTVSMDGRPRDHRAHRRALVVAGSDPSPDAASLDSYAHVVSLLPELLRIPRFVVTQTVPPSTADAADDNFAHLLSLGIRRFNFLPGYYIRWRQEQLDALRTSFAAMARRIEATWQRNERLYVRNLFTWAPTPFFNSGLVVDADRSIHPSNLGLSGALEELLDRTRVGDLDHPPTPEQLAGAGREVNGLLEAALPGEVWTSTLAVDAELTRFCRGLYPAFARHRRQRKLDVRETA